MVFKHHRQRFKHYVQTRGVGGRLLVLLAALVLFVTTQIAAGVVEAMSDVGVLLLGPPVLLGALLSLYMLYVLARATAGSLWSRTGLRTKREA